MRRTAFFGSDAFSRDVLQALLGHTGQPSSVTAVFENASGEFAQYAVNRFDTVSESWKTADYSSFDVGLVASFGAFIPLRLMRQFRTGTILNVHPSLLPLYRGAAPIQRCLMDRHEETAVSIIDCDAKTFDAGAIWMQERVKLTGGETYGALAPKLASMGGRMLATILGEFEQYRGNRMAQPTEGITFAPKIIAADGLIESRAITFDRIFAIHRAIGHQVKICLTDLLPGRHVILHDIEPSASKPVSTVSLDRSSKLLHVPCADGLSLPIRSAGVQGKSNRFPATDLYNMLRPKPC